MPYSNNKKFIKASKYLDNNKFQKALKIFKELYRSGLVDSGLNIGYIYEKIGQTQKAKKWYKRLIHKKKDTGAMINLAIIYSEAHNIKKAKKYFKMAAKLGDGDASAELGKLYLCEADIQKANRYFTETIQSKNVCTDNIDLAKKYLLKIEKYFNRKS